MLLQVRPVRIASMDSLQPTILIVDDEKHTRDGLRRLLEDDYDTYVAEDIRGAILRESHGLLHPEGAFVVYQFTRAVLPSLRRTFARVQQDFELRNILPARLFYCTR